jgi:hypothetical protein
MPVSPTDLRPRSEIRVSSTSISDHPSEAEQRESDQRPRESNPHETREDETGEDKDPEREDPDKRSGGEGERIVIGGGDQSIEEIVEASHPRASSSWICSTARRRAPASRTASSVERCAPRSSPVVDGLISTHTAPV